jgi:hypothetical protein
LASVIECIWLTVLTCIIGEERQQIYVSHMELRDLSEISSRTRINIDLITLSYDELKVAVSIISPNSEIKR